MRQLWIYFFIVSYILSGSAPAEARRPIQKIKLQSALKAELNQVLKDAVGLQEASFKQNDQATSSAIKRLVKSIDEASAQTHLAKEQQTHMLKILVAAKTYLEKSRRTMGSDRQTYFQKAFHQLVVIAQVYQLDPYKIFFCPRDKSVWIQKGMKPQNPINPEVFGSCGKLAS